MKILLYIVCQLNYEFVKTKTFEKNQNCIKHLMNLCRINLFTQTNSNNIFSLVSFNVTIFNLK